MLEENPDFVCIKLDVENAFNSSSRAKCVTELESIPELRHLAWHAATSFAPNTALHTNGEIWGQAEEGKTQGDPEASPYFCVTWHRYIRAAGEALRSRGGAACFIMDDGYLVGPWSAVLTVFQLLEKDLKEECGLTLQRTKCELFTREGVLPNDCPEGLSLAGTDVKDAFEPGFLCVGTPVGTDKYVSEMLTKKIDELEKEIQLIMLLLGEERQALWTVLRASTQHKLEYWLGSVHPSQMVGPAKRMDQLIREMLEAASCTTIPLVQGEPRLGYETVLDVPVDTLRGHSFQWFTAQLPEKLGGLGVIYTTRASSSTCIPCNSGDLSPLLYRKKRHLYSIIASGWGK